ETPGFTRAVAMGTRTRSGQPGTRNWVQGARYRIDARLDPTQHRLSGHEFVTYLNHSPDTLARIAVYLRQNAFAGESPKRDFLPVTKGMQLTRVGAGGQTLQPIVERPRRGAAPTPGYRVNGTIMWIQLPAPVLPGDSTSLEFSWSYEVPPSPSDGRQGREADVYIIGYWYPQVAVYDDLDGWVTDPYTGGAEFYMDPADYDVRLMVPRGWVVGATGTLQDSSKVLSRRSLDRIAAVRGKRDPVRVIGPEDWASAGGLASTGSIATWHFTARNVRDFAWGAGNRYIWDVCSALVKNEQGGTDTVMISSFFRKSDAAAAWALGGARFTRDAIEQMSVHLWPYPWPSMTSMQPWPDTLSLAGDLMHETAHMWFPMQVGSNETRHAWMDEGFTQYNVAQGMRVLYGEPRQGGRPNDSEPGQRQTYLRPARAGEDAALMTWSDLFPLDLYFISNYNKTANVLVALRAIMGPEQFHAGLRSYGRAWRGRHPDPVDFFNAMNSAAGQDLGWFWSTWFYNAWPLDQAIAGAKPVGDSLEVTIEDRGLAPMPVRLAVMRKGGAVERIELPVGRWLSGARTMTVKLTAPATITSVQIDPEGVFPDIHPENQRWAP
ncbi:MAG TPA: M1 family metallopeptidase, partial [Gemmatimonadales bacterium]|nr:M1 family metallopeptidase [Gemmatimonadales bacterium]